MMIQGDLVIHQCSLLSLYLHKASCQYLVYEQLESKFKNLSGAVDKNVVLQKNI